MSHAWHGSDLWTFHSFIWFTALLIRCPVFGLSNDGTIVLAMVNNGELVLAPSCSWRVLVKEAIRSQISHIIIPCELLNTEAFKFNRYRDK